MKKLLTLIFILLLLGCEQDLEKEKFGVYFYYPNDKEEYLGEVIGFSSCQSTASYKAVNSNIDDWSYICCLITSSSTCESKHK